MEGRAGAEHQQLAHHVHAEEPVAAASGPLRRGRARRSTSRRRRPWSQPRKRAARHGCPQPGPARPGARTVMRRPSHRGDRPARRLGARCPGGRGSHRDRARSTRFGCLADHWLGVEGDPESGGRQHVDVIGAVADGDGAGQRHTGRLGEPLEGRGLAGPIDDGTLSSPVSTPSLTASSFAARWSIPMLSTRGRNDLGEAAATTASS